MAGLYVHIPFCATRCSYCGFYSTTKLDLQDRYVDSLCREIALRKEYLSSYSTDSKAANTIIRTIYIGGGTPSQLSRYSLEKLFHAIDTYLECSPEEVTMEVNPDDVTNDLAETISALHINRVSMGAQTFDDNRLKFLNRRHKSFQVERAIDILHEHGVGNISIDLMFGFPGQTCDSWKEDVRRAISLDIQHISAYSLIIEEGTPFYEKYGEGERAEARRRRELPDEDTERLMYQFTKNILQNYGYHRYEISNYAKEGYECRHNLGYWNRTEYLGIGTGAASLINNQRFVEGGEIEVLTPQNQMEEYMFLGLRRIKGISKADFRRTFGRSVENVYGKVLIHMYQKQLLEDTGDNIRLTEKGIDVSNYVMSEFLF